MSMEFLDMTIIHNVSIAEVCTLKLSLSLKKAEKSV